MKKLFSLLMCGSIFLLYSCEEWGQGRKYEHPPFSTQYTVEEHIERISDITDELLVTAEVIGEIIDYKVEIVYSYDKDLPQLFMVQYEYAEEFKYFYRSGRGEARGYISKFEFVIGYIENDEYKLGLKYGCLGFMCGKNPYQVYEEITGETVGKKYYGSTHFGIEKEGKKYNIVSNIIFKYVF